MPVIKKTVALHPIMDNYVRMLQAILIQKGWNATYSTALNYMVLYNVMDVSTRKMHRKVLEVLRDFLHDRRTIREIQRQDRLTEYLEKSRRQIEQAYIG